MSELSKIEFALVRMRSGAKARRTCWEEGQYIRFVDGQLTLCCATRGKIAYDLINDDLLAENWEIESCLAEELYNRATAILQRSEMEFNEQSDNWNFLSDETQQLWQGLARDITAIVHNNEPNEEGE